MNAGGRGRLVALEGIDGCGKSTQARRLADAIDAVLTREPGGTDLGRALRAVLLEPSDAAVSDRAEALLMAADRAQHVIEVIEPALAVGRWVVTDRFSASTLAYQGSGRGLGLDELDSLIRWATRGLEPDLNVLVDVPVDVAAGRRTGSAPDRIEGLDRAFHEGVGLAYRKMAEDAPDRWLVVDGTADLDTVSAAILGGVRARLGAPTRG